MAMPRDGVQTLRDTGVQPLGQTDVQLQRRSTVAAIMGVRVWAIEHACKEALCHASLALSLPLQQCSNNARSLRGVASHGPYGVWQLILNHPCHHQRRKHGAAQAFQSHKVFFSFRENPFEHSTPMKGYRVGCADVIPAPVQDPGRGPGSRRGEAVSLRSVRCRVGFAAGMAKALPADHRRCDNGPKGR